LIVCRDPSLCAFATVGQALRTATDNSKVFVAEGSYVEDSPVELIANNVVLQSVSLFLRSTWEPGCLYVCAAN
jgi:hypothetical protein